MRKTWGPACMATVLAAALSAMASPAGAEPIVVDEADRTHHRKVGLHAQVGTGYRVVGPYNKEFCGEAKDVCLGRSPVALDLGAAYGVSPRVEVFLELRLGLEKDFGVAPGAGGPRLFAVAPGVKLYINEVGVTKFFSTLQLAVDFTDYDQAPGTDYAVKNTNGLQLDVHETVGLFFYVGEIIGWNRWLRFEMEGGIGLQARFP